MPPTFTAAGVEHAYFDHAYNVTARNERAVEVPVALHFLRHLEASARVLEVGNVLAHYPGAPERTVVDLHERADGVVNADVRTWQAPHEFDAIVAISTLEHVGWDQPDPDPGAAWEAIARLRGMLVVGGRLLVTVPIGYHPPLDGQIARHRPRASSDVLMLRTGPDLSWRQATGSEWSSASYDARHRLLLEHRYDRHTPTATAVWIGGFYSVGAGQRHKPAQGG